MNASLRGKAATCSQYCHIRARKNACAVLCAAPADCRAPFLSQKTAKTLSELGDGAADGIVQIGWEHFGQLAQRLNRGPVKEVWLLAHRESRSGGLMAAKEFGIKAINITDFICRDCNP